MQVVISPSGCVRCVYDELLDLKALGKVDIERGSYVEPDADGQWWADLGPCLGPRLGPFARRSKAIQAEKGWLDQNWLPTGNRL